MRAFDATVYERAKRHILGWNRDGAVGSLGDDPFRCRVAVEVIDETVPWPRNAATDGLFALWQEAGSELQMRVGREERGGRCGIWTALDIAGRRPWAGRWLDQIVAARVPTVMVFADGDDGIEYLRNRLARRLDRAMRSGILRVVEVPGIDH